MTATPLPPPTYAIPTARRVRSATSAYRFSAAAVVVPAAMAALVAVGLAGIARGDDLIGGRPDAARQAVWAGMSCVAMAVTSAIPVRVWRRWAWPLAAATLVLLVAVYFTPARNGARRWIPLGPIAFQPSEVAKLVFVLVSAAYLARRESHRTVFGLIPPFLVAAVPSALILREPDLGTALLFGPVLLMTLFAAGARPRHLAAVVLAGACSLPLLWLGMNAEQRSRVTTLFEQRDVGDAPRGDGYHLFQSKRVLSLGGTWGSAVGGVPPVDPRDYHLPEARTDFVLCLVGERYGLVGVSGTFGLYAALFWGGFAAASRCRDPFGRLVASGVTSLLAVQTAINAGMTVGLTPITGLTLPLLSYGGTSLVVTSAALGMVVSVAMRPGHRVGGTPFRFRD
ncbi:MAG: FtsW/RodA/SpoVE family cell cycle protein [Planctomycetota bacterium]